MSYTFLDWRYALPCGDRLPHDVRKSLSPWFLDLLPRALSDVHGNLSMRWKKIPRPLAPLRDRILEGGKPAIVGRLGNNYLELTLGAQGQTQELPWIPRTWSTPTTFFPDKAREYLARERASSKKELAAMTDENVQYLAYKHFGRQPLLDDNRGDDEAREWAVYVAPPVQKEGIAGALGNFGFAPDGLLAEFVRAFDGLRESEPGLAGGFIPHREWITAEQDLRVSKYSWYEHLPADEKREWKDAVLLFHARNGDHVLLHPTLKAGWMLHEEARVEPKWPTFEAFVAGYADALEYRWPFDGYGPSTEAIEARRQRESKKKPR
jgi:hypothetical protein